MNPALPLEPEKRLRIPKGSGRAWVNPAPLIANILSNISNDVIMKRMKRTGAR